MRSCRKKESPAIPQNGSILDPETLYQTLDVWAQRYSPDEGTRSALVDQTLQKLGGDLGFRKNAGLKNATGMLHRIAVELLTRTPRPDHGHWSSTPPRGSGASSSDHKVLAGRRILVVEDDYLTASDLLTALTLAGAEAFGPISRAKQAVEIASEFSLDAAVLDIHLLDGTVYEAAAGLMKRQIPFVFLTGYDRSVVPNEFGSAPFLSKPCDPDALVVNFAALLPAS